MTFWASIRGSERNRKKPALAIQTGIDVQIAADLLRKRSHDFHPETRALRRIEVRRQPASFIHDRNRMRRQSNHDVARPVLHRVRNQFVDDKAERDREPRRDCGLRSFQQNLSVGILL